MNRHPLRPHRATGVQAVRSHAAYRQSLLLVLLATALALVMPLRAQPQAEGPTPRVGAPQAPGALHTVRQIPEACVRLEGRYAAAGYDLQVVPVGGACQPRARFVDAARAQPSATAGWTLNDVVRIPEAACAGREAVVQVWRKAGGTVARDGQGQTRVYLEEGREQAASAAASLPQFSAVVQTPSGACG